MEQEYISFLIDLYNHNRITLEELITDLIKGQNIEPNKGVINHLVNNIKKITKNNHTLTLTKTLTNDDAINNTINVCTENNYKIFVFKSGYSSNNTIETGMFKENNEEMRNFIFQHAHPFNIDRNLYTIASIANCVIGNNEIYQFTSEREVKNNKKYKYYLFDNSGTLKKSCDVDKNLNQLIDNYTNSDGTEIQDVYYISQMSEDEMIDKGEKYLLEHGSWNKKLIKTFNKDKKNPTKIPKSKTKKKKMNKWELRSKLLFAGGALLIMYLSNLQNKYDDDYQRYQEIISEESLENIINDNADNTYIDEILEKDNNQHLKDLYLLDKYLRLEKEIRFLDLYDYYDINYSIKLTLEQQKVQDLSIEEVNSLIDNFRKLPSKSKSHEKDILGYKLCYLKGYYQNWICEHGFSITETFLKQLIKGSVCYINGDNYQNYNNYKIRVTSDEQHHIDGGYIEDLENNKIIIDEEKSEIIQDALLVLCYVQELKDGDCPYETTIDTLTRALTIAKKYIEAGTTYKEIGIINKRKILIPETSEIKLVKQKLRK